MRGQLQSSFEFNSVMDIEETGRLESEWVGALPGMVLHLMLPEGSDWEE